MSSALGSSMKYDVFSNVFAVYDGREQEEGRRRAETMQYYLDSVNVMELLNADK